MYGIGQGAGDIQNGSFGYIDSQAHGNYSEPDPYSAASYYQAAAAAQYRSLGWEGTSWKFTKNIHKKLF